MGLKPKICKYCLYSDMIERHNSRCHCDTTFVLDDSKLLCWE